MNDQEKEKRGKVAELMYELLDFGRMEQLARDIWDKAPEGVKREVADLFANRIKSEIARQATWVEPQVDRYGAPVEKHTPKPMMQLAFENVVQKTVEHYLTEHSEEIQSQLLAAMKEKFNERVEKEGAYLLERVFSKARDGVEKALRGY